MFTKWFEEYRKLSERTIFISQTSAFIISIFTFLSLYDLYKYYIDDSKSFLGMMYEKGLLSAIIFQITILLLFSLRFALFFLKIDKVFGFNQILWLIGAITLIGYWYFLRYDDSQFGIYQTYNSIFRHASRSFDFLGWTFLILSPVKETVTLITSLFKSK